MSTLQQHSNNNTTATTTEHHHHQPERTSKATNINNHTLSPAVTLGQGAFLKKRSVNLLKLFS
jgi:hypothetical protein